MEIIRNDTDDEVTIKLSGNEAALIFTEGSCGELITPASATQAIEDEFNGEVERDQMAIAVAVALQEKLRDQEFLVEIMDNLFDPDEPDVN